jgi:hypothetical protein
MRSTTERRLSLSLRFFFLQALFILGVGFSVLGCISTSRPNPGTPLPVKGPESFETSEALFTPVETAEAGTLSEQSLALLPAERGILGSLPNLTQYDIALTIQKDRHSFEGQARVILWNNEKDALRSLFFRLLPNGGDSYGDGELTVLQTWVGRQPAKTALTLDDSILEVFLPADLQPGDHVQVDFEFQGLVPIDFGGGGAPFAYGIFNYAEEVLALSGWYPILSVYDEEGWHLDPVSPIGDSVFSETALYKVQVTMPKDLILAATGVELSRKWDGDRIRYELVSGPVRDFFLIASPRFSLTSQEIDGTRVNSYVLRGDESSTETSLTTAVHALRIYNERFGSYPYRELDIVEAPLRNALGVEFPAIVLIGESLYKNLSDPTFAVTIAHEVAHQWWYGVVGNDVFAEPWLDEALATYSSGIYVLDSQGGSGFQGLMTYWQTRYDDLVSQGGDDLVTQNVQHFESLNNPGTYSGVIYIKGALFFHVLRETIGDRDFFRALQQYYAGNSYQVASIEDLLDAFEQTSGQDLDEFYQNWLYEKR